MKKNEYAIRLTDEFEELTKDLGISIPDLLNESFRIVQTYIKKRKEGKIVSLATISADGQTKTFRGDPSLKIILIHDSKLEESLSRFSPKFEMYEDPSPALMNLVRKGYGETILNLIEKGYDEENILELLIL